MLIKGGRICLTRLKYINNLGSNKSPFKVLKLLFSGTWQPRRKDALFWYLNVNEVKEGEDLSIKHLNVNYFYSNEILDKDNKFSFDRFPDPIHFLCGVQLDKDKLNEK